MQMDIFTYKTDLYLLVDIMDLINHRFPFGKIRFACINIKFPAYDLGELRFFEHQGCFIKIRQSNIFYNAVFLYITEVCDLLHDLIFQRFIAP